MRQMAGSNPIDRLRFGVKRLVRNDQYRWLDAPARYAWYYFRAIRELRHVPGVLSRLRKSQRSQQTSELIQHIFVDFAGMFRPFQNRMELQRFIGRVREMNPRAILEIGTARGGTLILLASVAAPHAQLVSIDLPAGSYGGGYPLWKGILYRRLMGKGQRLQLIRGNSHETRTFEEAQKVLAGKQIDLLFIDGDHSYSGAKQDFLLYRTLVRPGGTIAFHDILDNPRATNITVAPLWREIKRSFKTEEIVNSYEQGEFGIGLVDVPEKWDA